MLLAARIRIARRRKKLSQIQLAKLLRTTQGSVSRWEIGVRKPEVVMLRRLATALGVTTDYLLE